MTTKLKTAFLAATLVSSTVAVNTASAADETMGKCHGVNSCKGQTACATAEGSCAGTNSCKGKGWLPMKNTSCEEKGGKFESMKK